MPFIFESTGVETRFTNGLDPQTRARPLFASYRPGLLLKRLAYLPPMPEGHAAQQEPLTFLAGLCHLAPLVTEWGQGGASYQLWPAQICAIQNLERSLAAHEPSALVRMATGSGKTFTVINAIYQLIKFGGARRLLFLVDRGIPIRWKAAPAWSSAPSSACSACSRAASCLTKPKSKPPKALKACSKAQKPRAHCLQSGAAD
jgi:type I restriction enzyme, R subunit